MLLLILGTTGTALAWDVYFPPKPIFSAVNRTVFAHPSGDVIALADGRAHRLRAADGTVAWQSLPAHRSPAAVTPSGDVVIGGSNPLHVAYLEGASGVERWRFPVEGTGGAVAVDATGDVVVVQPRSSGTTKLAALDGSVLWHAAAPFWTHPTSWAAVDAAGDVLVGGRTDAGYPASLLSGVDGTLRWSVNVGTTPDVRPMPHPDGDVVVTARSAVVKLDASTGAERWRVPTTDLGNPLLPAAADPAGNLAVVVRGGTVLKLDGVTGAALWARSGLDFDEPRCLAVDGAGDVYVGGSEHQLRVLKLDGASGGTLWEHDFFAGPVERGELDSCVLSSTGVLVVGGQLEVHHDDAGIVMTLDTATGDPTSPACGDGVLDAGEACDDGNRASKDGCDALCRLDRCGNGVLDPGEWCDDAADPTGICTPFCEFRTGIGLSQEQRRCIVSLDKDLGSVMHAQGKAVEQCIGRRVKERIASADACLAMPANPLDKARVRTEESEQRWCIADPPRYGYTSAATVNAAAASAELALTADLFGPSLDAVLGAGDAGQLLAACQRGVGKQVAKCRHRILADFNACVKTGLGFAGSISDPADIARCLLDEDRGQFERDCDLSEPKPNGRVTVDEIRKALSRCASLGVDFATGFPGCGVAGDLEATHACVWRRVRCRVCLAVRDANGLPFMSCDGEDDGEQNGSCGP